MRGYEWRNETLIFYLAIIITIYLSAKILSGKKIRIKNKRIDLGILVPCLILLFIKGFAFCGIDLTIGYKLNFESIVSLTNLHDTSLEIGYRLLMLIVKKVWDNYSFFVFVIGVLTLAPVMWVISRLQKNINVPFAILAYTCIYFFQGISLVRIFLAASLSLLSFYCLYKDKNIIAIIWVGIAVLFHKGAIVMIAPCLVKIFKINKKIFWITVVLSMLYVIGSREFIMSFFAGSRRYYVYNGIPASTIGLEWVFNYIPFFLLYYMVKEQKRKYKITDETLMLIDHSFVWVIIGVAISLVAYSIPIVGRMYAFTIPIIVYTGAALKYLKAHKNREVFISYKMLIFIYFIARFLIYLYGYWKSDGIMPYINVFGWII